MANQLTYILGAGASFQSIPVVKTFNSRLYDFNRYLTLKASNKNGQERKKFLVTANYIHSLVNEFSAHQSFDTYFKKLFHFGDYSNINLGKRLLNLYFLWEHSKSSLEFIGNQNEYDFRKKSLFDRRYDALIAGLLQPFAEKSVPLCKVNFISWNYDINLINSIKNFFYPTISYGEFIKRVKRNQFLWEIDENIKIVNVNGHFYSTAIDESQDLLQSNPEQILESKIFEDYHISKEIDEDADRIKFSWELNDRDERSLKTVLQSIISETQDIIVIGYTFPLYNRFIDFGYLKQEDLINKNMIVQDPNAAILTKNLADIFRLKIEKANIIPIDNCDGFYVPSSVFGIEDYKHELPILAG